jgi:Spy/CpxP family protein refolding chaperone
MNRWIRRGALVASLAGSLAVVTGAVAYAQNAQVHSKDGENKWHHRDHRGGLLGAALKLDSITAEQRSSIEQLTAQRRTASAPVREADAQVLTVLAQQVEQAKIDPQGLAPSLSAEQSAAAAENTVDRDSLNQLHSILSVAQRNQLVDRLEAGRAKHEQAEQHEGARKRFGFGLGLTPDQQSQIRANLKAEAPADAAAAKDARAGMLEAFRGDSFDASAFVNARIPGEHMERLAAAMVPVLSPSQRATFASHLRTRAQHESSPKSS